MTQYIDKEKVIKEIARRIKYDEMVMDHDAQITELRSRELNTLYELSSFIKSLEVKEVQEPTAADMGMVEEIIINLKRVEQDYHIDLTKEMEWLRNLMKKGEQL